MSSPAVNQISFRTPLGAVNNGSSIRVYSQAVDSGIRESAYEGVWTGGKNPLVTAKLNSPIAATSVGLTNISVYYLLPDNTLGEQCYDQGKGWYNGALTGAKFPVAAYTSIAACYLPGSGTDARIRVYAQVEDNTIQEFGIDNPNKGWFKMTNLGAALPGAGIATCAYALKNSAISIRTYTQDNNLTLVEHAYDTGKGWFMGSFSVPDAVTRASIAVYAFNTGATSSNVSLRVYYSGKDGLMLEKGFDGLWYQGAFSVPSIPGSAVGCIQARIYRQNGTDVSAVSEWMWTGKWIAGQAALPPA
ncbi:fungal fucose-specific lectin [Mollisia scopiformis]|uniref:Fungal fucose-specific lectin n=1 Tax=Mollisia scopiformis TaxID=149040 RepID=A0A132B5G3_MOLSC|nr:fungal fucose-specific lectin [Mollisia scopiformis]KUJ07134.1 fungal fucose-specific lectin [Mollisia scopiformis]